MRLSCLTPALLVISLAAHLPATTYYFDGTNGLDNNTGRTTASPWKSITKVRSLTLQPGDSVALRSGTSFDGNLWLTLSGQPGRPIVFTSWGSGSMPIVSNRADSAYQIWAINNSSHVVVEKLHFRGVFADAFEFRGTSSHDTLRDCEIDSVGMGVNMEGTANSVLRTYIHDLHIINNTPGGDDDYGAVALCFAQADSCEVRDCRMERCQDVSYDYGFDGGVVETWRNVRHCRAMYNRGTDCNGFFEAGGQAGDSVVDFTLAYNVSENCGDFMCFHTGGSGNFEIGCAGIHIHNNTVVQTDTAHVWALMITDGEPTDRSLFDVRNNVFYFANVSRVYSATRLTHEHNVYYSTQGSVTLGLTADTSERIANPLFANVGSADYRLQFTSPCRDAGLVLGYSRDFIGTAVPTGTRPDIGAYEYASSAVNQPARAATSRAQRMVQPSLSVSLKGPQSAGVVVRGTRTVDAGGRLRTGLGH
jgi:hypothetical protein